MLTEYLLIDDMKSSVREAWVGTHEDFAEATENYSGWYTVRNLGEISAEEAEDIAFRYNEYIGEPDVELHCCSEGCTMSAYEYAHMSGCTYSGT